MFPTSRREVIRARRHLRDENARWPAQLYVVEPAAWPPSMPFGVERVLRSRTFLVQVYQPHVPTGAIRLSVCRTELAADGARWKDDITWEELQRLKGEAGFADREAVEVFPPDTSIVNVANMRHLWVLPAGERMAFSW